jgi:hypothetical protein
MVKLYDTEQLAERADNLGTLNGLERVFVSLQTVVSPTLPDYAWLDIEFYNTNHLGSLSVADFSISGGSRIMGGNATGQVHAIEINAIDDNTLHLKVAPVGDYSKYVLKLKHAGIDPLFSEVDFKFRPGCFNANCAKPGNDQALAEEPVIDYLAKDYDSFKHVLMNAMRERVPGWQPSSEADLDQVLIDLIAADADELSDSQDRVMNEAYFGRARKRVSLARHARLMDYHIHQGNQASTWLALQVNADGPMPTGFPVWTGASWNYDNAVIFAASHAQQCYAMLNELKLYDWGGVVTALEVNSTQADLTTGSMSELEAQALRKQMLRSDLSLTERQALRDADAIALVLEEKLNPETGSERGRDKTRRQFLRLLDDDAMAAEIVEDPLGSWFVRVRWREEDKLERRFCFTTACNGVATSGVSAFHANLIKATHGRPHRTVFHPAAVHLDAAIVDQIEYQDHVYYEETEWGVVCPLPHAPLAYLNTPPGGEKPVYSTLQISVGGQVWQEQNDLIESQSDDRHFVVETDERGFSSVRFGNGINGQALPQKATVTCYYQVGRGSAGNIGADTLAGFENSPGVVKVWNPLDVSDGRDPEQPEEIIRRVPEAYRSRQLRAVTLQDYIDRAEELDAVSHANAAYAWVGSWRTVRVSIDPKNTTELSETLRQEIATHLDAVRLIGEDLEVRAAHYVGLDINMALCVSPEFWPEDIEDVLQIEFSDAYTANGRTGFFHPDCWTFGQPLHASQLMGRALAIQGVERVLKISMRRWYAGTESQLAPVIVNAEALYGKEISKLDVKPDEIIQVSNDPSRMEQGLIRFDIMGGRR